MDTNFGPKRSAAVLVGFSGAVAVIFLFLVFEILVRLFPGSGAVVGAWLFGHLMIVPGVGLLQAVRIVWHARLHDDRDASTIAAILALATSLYSFISATGPT